MAFYLEFDPTRIGSIEVDGKKMEIKQVRMYQFDESSDVVHWITALNQDGREVDVRIALNPHRFGREDILARRQPRGAFHGR